MTVLFASAQRLERAEDIKPIWDAYRGKKQYTKLSPWRTSEEIENGDYGLLVTDEYPSKSNAPVLMVGHGISGGKTGGLDQPFPYFNRKDAKLLTWVISSSATNVGMTAKRSGVDASKVLAYGMPKTDTYIGKKKGEGGTGLTAKRIYLYAPTYRTWEEGPDPEVDYKLISRLLSDDELLVVKHHMATGDKDIHGLKHIMQISSEEPSTPYIIDCDVLITDYSSIMMDAHILQKPVILFAKDKDKYLKVRGMYRPYPSGYASRFTDDEKDLVRMMRVAKGQKQEDIRCRWECAGACDGHSVERIIKLIEGVLNGHEEAM